MDLGCCYRWHLRYWGRCIYSLFKFWPRQMIQSRMCSLGNLREDRHWWLAYRHRNQLNKDKSLAAFCGSANWCEGHAFPLWVWIEASWCSQAASPTSLKACLLCCITKEILIYFCIKINVNKTQPLLRSCGPNRLSYSCSVRAPIGGELGAFG